MTIRLLAIDIDGTLLDSDGHVPDANRDAITRAMEAGVEIVLATGRRYDFARPIFEALPGPLTLILSNGAVVKTREGQTLMRHLLPRDVAREVLAHAPGHRESAAVIFDRPREGQVVYEVIDWEHPQHHRFFATNRPYLAEVAPLEDCLTEDPVQVMFSGGCAEMRALHFRLKAEATKKDSGDFRLKPEATHTDSRGFRLQPEVPAAEQTPLFEVALTEYEHRDFSLVDIVRAGCSKGSALREWAAMRGVARDGVMAVGDNLNDLPMLEFAGTPVLMGNALGELKARGWAVTSTNDEAGVARAIETFVLDKVS